MEIESFFADAKNGKEENLFFKRGSPLFYSFILKARGYGKGA